MLANIVAYPVESIFGVSRCFNQSRTLSLSLSLFLYLDSPELSVRRTSSCFSDNVHRHLHAPDLSARNEVIDACAAHFDSLVRRFQAADSAVSDARRAEVAKHSRNWHAVPRHRRTGAVFQSLHVIALPLDVTMLANRTSVGTIGLGDRLRASMFYCRSRCGL